MKQIRLIFILLLLSNANSKAQGLYTDSMQAYFVKYINAHEVVVGDEKKGFSFFQPNEAYRVRAKVELTPTSSWFTMPTSSGSRKTYRTYGYLHFAMGDSLCTLAVLQPQSLLLSPTHSDYLFIPFTDLSNEDSTYDVGRYLDIQKKDFVGNEIWLDFNKAYNPYCAYVSDKYNCPIPPKENRLQVRIDAGEKRFIRN